MSDLRTPRGGRAPLPLTPQTVLPTDPRLIVFLDALQRAGEQELCTPPGLGGGWLVKHVRQGLEAGVLVVHHRGTHLAFAAFPSDHRKAPCRCRACDFDRLTQGRDSGQLAQDKARELRHEILSFQFTGPRPRVEALDADV